MKNLQINTNPEVEQVFKNYPDYVRSKMERLRKIILETAKETEVITSVEETLKWGEPSFLTRHGSTIRIDWKDKKPEQYAIYFKCTSKLVSTFKAVYQELFEFEGNRAIVFNMMDELPAVELKKCIATGLRYHKVKHLPLLGI